MRIHGEMSTSVWDEWPEYFRGLSRLRYRLEFLQHMPNCVLERRADKVYFTDTSGIKWRIYDVSFGPPHAKPHCYHKFYVGDRRATSGIFVGASGVRRSYMFVSSDSRELAPGTCELQLARAAYLSTGYLGAKDHRAR
jgi:hypothetical protein